MNVIPALIEKKGNIISVKSPMVGIYDLMPSPNSLVSEQSSLGRITNLRAEYKLIFSTPIQGRVVNTSHSDKIVKVEYCQELFQLKTNMGNLTSKESHPSKKKGQPTDTENGHTIRAFTTGIFYLNPSPDSPPFVKKDQIIQKGKVLGLIEVMKTFNQIVFQGIKGSRSADWIIKEIYPQNGEEVKLGDPLFLLEEISRKP